MEIVISETPRWIQLNQWWKYFITLTMQVKDVIHAYHHSTKILCTLNCKIIFIDLESLSDNVCMSNWHLTKINLYLDFVHTKLNFNVWRASIGVYYNTLIGYLSSVSIKICSLCNEVNTKVNGVVLNVWRPAVGL